MVQFRVGAHQKEASDQCQVEQHQIYFIQEVPVMV
jgi:hypothetical protein